jgi:TonB-linked SusC/RagA family outer membrane protein
MMKQVNIFSLTKAILFLFVGLSLFSVNAQNSIVSDVKGVVSCKGKPLAKVSVSVEDDFVQTYTDADGKFIIRAKEGDRLLFSAIGYKPEAHLIKEGEDLLKIEMEVSAVDQKYEVGYSQRSKTLLTAAVSAVSGDALSKIPVPTVNDAVQGTVGGLTVERTSGNEPGWSLSNFYVRGIGTFGNGRTPLFMVDDVERDISQLDPEEIESFSVLKDAAATANYGIRGANGVIKVRTKRGHSGKPVVGLKANFGFQAPAQLPEYLDAQEYVKFRNIALHNEGLAVPNDPSYDPKMYDGTQNSFIYPNTDWYSEFIRKTSPQQMYRLSVDGGTNTVRYYVTFGVTNQLGIYKYTNENSGFNTNPSYTRYNVRVNTDIDLSKYLTVSLDLGGKLETKRVPNVSAANIFTALSGLPPTIPIKNEDGSIAGTSEHTNNPYGYLARSGYEDQYNRYLQGNVSAVYKFDAWVRGLSGNTMVAFDTYKRNGRGKSQSFAVYQRNQDGTYSKFGTNDTDLTLGYNSSDYGYSLLNTFTIGLAYENTFNKVHRVSSDLKYMQSGYEEAGNYPVKHDQNVFGHLSYAYNDRYVAELGYSYSGSENFSRSNRYGFFPTISGAWIISNEAFLKNRRHVNFLKLRASYGMVGNSNIGLGRFPYMSQFYLGGGYVFGTAYSSSDGSYEGRLNNTGITFEKSLNANIGVDLELFKSKLVLNIDLFRNDRSRIITTRSNTLPGIIGQSLPYENLGSVLNKGFEAALKYQGKVGNVGYFAQANVSFARNKITYMEETAGQEPWTYQTGRQIDAMRGLQAIGFFNTQDEINGWAKSTYGTVSPGDAKYKDQNGDKIIDANDWIPLEYSNIPEWNFGLNIGGSYKNFEVSFLVTAVANRTVMVSNNVFAGLLNNSKVTNTAYDTWQQGVNEATAKYPRLTTQEVSHNLQNSTIWSHNGSYVRLQNLEVGYNLPKSFLSHVKIADARLYLNGYNLFSIDQLKKYHLSADYPNAGINAYPEMRVYNIGVNVKF